MHKPIIHVLAALGGCDARKDVLDIGCGSGEAVKELRVKGVYAKGADLKFKKGPCQEELEAEGILNRIDPVTLRLPYENNSFDYVVADQVLEHVRDLEKFAFEVSRVLKPGGVFVAYYPSRWKLWEPHIGVPLAGVIRWRWWLVLWVKLGVYKTKRSGPPVDAILAYLSDKTCYRSLRSVKNTFVKYLLIAQFGGKLLLKTFDGKRGKWIVLMPLGAYLFNALWSSMLIARSPVNKGSENPAR